MVAAETANSPKAAFIPSNPSASRIEIVKNKVIIP